MEKRGVGGDKSGKRGYDPEEDGGEFEKEETVICVLAERLHCLTGRRERVKSHTASLFLLVFFFYQVTCNVLIYVFLNIKFSY